MTTTTTTPASTSSTGAMSFAEIEQLWIANGGSKAAAPVMAAIAIAESGGRSTALNNTPATGDYSVGLWQINYYDGLLASRTAEFGTPASLQGNANAQAQAAIKLSNNGTNLGPWKGDPVASAVMAGQPIPTKYTNGTTVSAASTGAAASGTAASTTPTCTPVIGEGGVLGIGSATLLNSCQAQEILGGLLIGIGGIVLIVGFAVVLADVGLRKSAPAIVGAVIGDRAGQRRATRSSQLRMTEREHSSGLRTQEREHAASARTYAKGTTVQSATPAEKRRWAQEGFGDE